MDLSLSSKKELYEMANALKMRMNTTNSPKAVDTLFDLYSRVLAELDHRHAMESSTRLGKNIIESRARAQRLRTMRARERGIPVGIPELVLPFSKKTPGPSKLSKKARRKTQKLQKKIHSY